MKVQEFFAAADAQKKRFEPRFNFKGAWLELGGVKKFYKSAWERNYARFLEREKLAGRILHWSYEPKTFWFEKIRRGTRSYKPDFFVVKLGGEELFVEVKGWMTPKSKIQLKRMRIYFPQVKILLVQANWFKGRKHFETEIEGWEK